MEYRILYKNSFGDWIFHRKTFTKAFDAITFAQEFVKHTYKVIGIVCEVEVK